MKNNTLLIIGIGALMLFSIGSKKVYTQTIGLRSNNPGNIRFSKSNNWKGQTGQNERGFVIFDTMENGIRALTILLRTYIVKTGQTTIAAIITKYAPHTENATDSYIKSVAKSTNIDAYVKLKPDAETLTKIVNAIIKHENGVNPIHTNTVASTVKKALA